MTELNKYFRSIRPTRQGLLAVVLLLFLIPLLVDIFLFPLNSKIHESMQMGGFLVRAYVKYLPWLLVYLLVFFTLWMLYKKIIKK